MTTAVSSSQLPPTVELAPSYWLPVAFVMAALPLFFVQVWVGLAIALLGMFLLLQTVTIRLRFTEMAMDVYRGDSLIRHFPYSEWQNWRIFWQPLPILFYFKEVKSIHFLPILFDAKTLQACLAERCPCRS
ncbi:Protein of unknown function (DUF3119) [Leptolyngbyaceae cyanobacterium JSC-12]|nr:Protein of unknown function (DUF3119) [Leptolyngbyaceae cyanobacterium JSC-12]